MNLLVWTFKQMLISKIEILVFASVMVVRQRVRFASVISKKSSLSKQP